MIRSETKRKKLLIVTDDANMGGTFRVAEQLVAGAGSRFDLSFACSFEQKNAAAREKIASSGVALFDYRVSERNPQRAAFALEDAQRLLDAAAPDVVLLVDGGEIWSQLALKQIAAARDIPYVVSINLLTEDCVRRFPELREMAIETLNAAQSIIFVSAASRRRFEALLPRVDRPKYVVANSRPARYFEIGGDVLRQATRSALGVRADETLFLCAARIEPRKGQTLCLEALELLRAQGRLSGLRLVLAGGGASGDIDSFHRAIQEKGLAEHVLTLGPRDDVPALLEACDAFVLASFSEGMPLSIIEAMAKGRPVVATAVDGVPEQIDRLSGILLPAPTERRADCVAALADALAALRDDPRKRTEMGRCARLRAVELFDEGRMIEEYGEIIAQAASGEHEKRRFGVLRAHPLLRRAMNGSLRWMRRLRSAQGPIGQGLAPGSTVDLSDPRQCWSHARDGWDVAEAGGVWNDGTKSSLRLRLRRPMRDLRIEFQILPFIPTGRRQETDVLVDGALAASWSFDAPTSQLRTIEIRGDQRSGTLEIDFLHKTAFSPRAAGLSDDARELAIFLRRIKVRRIPLSERLRGVLGVDLRTAAPWREGGGAFPAE